MICGWLEFLIAVSLMAGLIFEVVRKFAQDPPAAFFIALALAGIDFGITAVAASFFHSLTPLGWLLVQAVLTAITFLVLSRTQPHKKFWTNFNCGVGAIKKDRIAMVGLLLLSFIVCASMMDQLRSPVRGWDDTTYVGARVGYWLQHHDLFRYRNNNDRQVVFPFGGELFLLFPLLFTRVEWVARLMIWLAYPASILAVFLLLRLIGAGYRAAVWGALLLAATPEVLSASNCIKPELWSNVYGLGAVFFSIHSQINSERPQFALFFAGILAALALTTKLTMICFVPALLITTCAVESFRQTLRRFAQIVSGYVAGILGGGSIVTFYQNIKSDGHPFGPLKMQQVHSADFGLSQIWIHSIRFLLKIIDIPILPWKELQNALNTVMNGFANATGASQLLRWENSTSWPGVFQYQASTTAKAFSLTGILWLPVLMVVVWRTIRSFFGAPAKKTFEPQEIVAIFSATSFVAVLYGLRWQEMADVPFRFLLPSFTLGLILVVAAAEKLALKRPGWIYAITAATLFTIGPTIVQCVTITNFNEAPHIWPSAYAKVSEQLPAGSRIIQIGDQMSPEYYLFNPLHGYRNNVFPWGKDRFDASALRAFIDSVHPTHVLLDNDRRGLYFQWYPGVDTRPFASWLSQQPDLREIPAPVPLRLFEAQSVTVEDAQRK